MYGGTPDNDGLLSGSLKVTASLLVPQSAGSLESITSSSPGLHIRRIAWNRQPQMGTTEKKKNALIREEEKHGQRETAKKKNPTRLD